MGQHVDTRTIHTITIDVLDDTLAKLNAQDEIEIILASRYGRTRPIKLSFTNVRYLTDGYAGNLL